MFAYVNLLTIYDNVATLESAFLRIPIEALEEGATATEGHIDSTPTGDFYALQDMLCKTSR